MSDETKDLDQQSEDSDQQPAGEQKTEDWESRFKGLQRTYAKTKEELQGKLDDQREELETLEEQLAKTSTEKETLTEKQKQQIDELSESLSEKEQKLSELNQMQKKVEVANKLGHPELLQLIDTIPNTDDEEQIEKSMKTILGFTKKQVEAREQQITEGLSPGDAGGSETTMPSTEEGWQDFIDKQPLGSDEYNEAMDAYFNWTRQEE